MRLPCLLILSLISPLLAQPSSHNDVQSLLEFKKGIHSDPWGHIDTWTTDSLRSDGCPDNWHGIECTDGKVTSIALDGLELVGDLKFFTLYGLKQIKKLSLSNNHLTGRLVPAIGAISSLEHLDLSNNSFYGPLPGRLLQLWSLMYLNLSKNSFEGSIPSGIQALQKLRVVDLGGNKLTGNLPVFEVLSSIEIIRLGNNQFQGLINPGLLREGSIPLTELDLSCNNFSGSIDNITSKTLKLLNLSSNVLSGSLPGSLGNCTVVDLSKNMLSGNLSAMGSWEDTLEVIDLSDNALIGSVPNEMSQFFSLTSIKIRNNSLTGSLPQVLETLPKLSVIDLSFNQLTGGPVLSGLLSSLTLTSLHLSGNQFTGTISFQASRPIVSASIGMPSHLSLEFLDLSNNLLSGSLPPDIGKMDRLKLLNLGHNSLSGEMPIEISGLTSLEYLDLSFNHFKGSIPQELPLSVKTLNVSYNDLSGIIPETLERRFPDSSFHPGNDLLLFSVNPSPKNGVPDKGFSGEHHSHLKSGIKAIIIVGSIFGALVMIGLLLLFHHRKHLQEFGGRSDKITGRDIKHGRFTPPDLFGLRKNIEPSPTPLSFSTDHLLSSQSRSISMQKHLPEETAESSLIELREEVSETGKTDLCDSAPPENRKGSPSPRISSSPRSNDPYVPEQPVILNVYSPDRLAGDLFFLDSSLVFTAEELSRAPAEVLGRSSHGTSYKATLDSAHMLTVKWLREGLVKHKKEFSKDAKRIGSIRHPNIVSIRCYYWGPREHEKLIISDYINAESLEIVHHPQAPPLSFRQRLKIAIDVARALCYLHHEKGLPHGNLKPTNILLTTPPDFTARLTDYSLHRLMTTIGTADQILNLGALGYRAPELANANKPTPSFKADVYALGVIIMELLTGKSAGDIISGHSGAVDLADWVQLCASDGRGADCYDVQVVSSEGVLREMDDLLAVSLKCVLPVNARPDIRTVLDDLSSIS
ncbi:probable inactive receptor kinase At5g10020 isoform X1 [Amborella trichopoda]|uniref:Protein kinase domain-containing protein n=1 Tax=Amborella trichopoda TaxID=13333 RepID=W1NFR0_AMBTC|nr:probable inactive receptor kinase At5g10020 isoform X1 [Amborella trichopoda]ERM94316.1 hypothetical protein AMTR_s00010p00237840 [Amborella trichopoda]|eukprot:XP_006827079.1 probable inactive receptor kinase At5g10020 isoform X1 [Amborella trichopoda]